MTTFKQFKYGAIYKYGVVQIENIQVKNRKSILHANSIFGFGSGSRPVNFAAVEAFATPVREPGSQLLAKSIKCRAQLLKRNKEAPCAAVIVRGTSVQV
jgi:hypothetical protein